jgi:hypothetical protein
VAATDVLKGTLIPDTDIGYLLFPPTSYDDLGTDLLNTLQVLADKRELDGLILDLRIVTVGGGWPLMPLLTLFADGNLGEVYTRSMAQPLTVEGQDVFRTGEDRQPGVLGKLTILDLAKPTAAKIIGDELTVAFFWSPDSRKIAYFVPSVISPTPQPEQSDKSEESEQATVLLNLHVVDVGSNKSRRLATFQPPSQFLGILPYFDQYQHSTTVWSPDSRNLVLSAYASAGEPGIWVMPASGTLAMRYLADGLLAFWSWK